MGPSPAAGSLLAQTRPPRKIRRDQPSSSNLTDSTAVSSSESPTKGSVSSRYLTVSLMTAPTIYSTSLPALPAPSALKPQAAVAATFSETSATIRADLIITISPSSAPLITWPSEDPVENTEPIAPAPPYAVPPVAPGLAITHTAPSPPSVPSVPSFPSIFPVPSIPPFPTAPSVLPTVFPSVIPSVLPSVPPFSSLSVPPFPAPYVASVILPVISPFTPPVIPSTVSLTDPFPTTLLPLVIPSPVSLVLPSVVSSICPSVTPSVNGTSLLPVLTTNVFVLSSTTSSILPIYTTSYATFPSSTLPPTILLPTTILPTTLSSSSSANLFASNSTIVVAPLISLSSTLSTIYTVRTPYTTPPYTPISSPSSRSIFEASSSQSSEHWTINTPPSSTRDASVSLSLHSGPSVTVNSTPTQLVSVLSSWTTHGSATATDHQSPASSPTGYVTYITGLPYSGDVSSGVTRPDASATTTSASHMSTLLPPSPKAGPPPATVAGSVMGSVAGAAILLFLFALLLRWRKNHSRGVLLQVSHENNSGMAERFLLPFVPSLFGGQSGARAVRLALGTGPQRPGELAEPAEATEQGFFKVSGRKLPSVLQVGGDGYTDPRDSVLSMSPSQYDPEAMADAVQHGQEPLLVLGSPMRPISGFPMLRSSPARTPVMEWRSPLAEPCTPTPSSAQLNEFASSLAQTGSPSRFVESL